MAQVAVVTDSTACLPEELTQRYGIYIVPLSFAFEDRIYRDGVDITPTEFYRLLKKANHLPTTSSPPPPAYLESNPPFVPRQGQSQPKTPAVSSA